MNIRFSDLKQAAVNWYKNEPFNQSAAISYYTIFSFPALAFIYLSLASVFADEKNVQSQITGYFEGIVGSGNADSFKSIIEQTAPEQTSIIALIVGGLILLYAGLRLFMQLQRALNIIWQVKVPDNVNIWSLVKQRLMAFSVMLGVLFIMLSSLVITTFITSLGEYVTNTISERLMIFIYALNFIISFSIISGMFTILLKMLPDVYVKWRYAFAGGMLSGTLFIIGQYMLGIYFKMAKPASAYGVTASIILLMLWVSYTCLILLMGAEYTRVIQENKSKNATQPTDLAINLKPLV